MSEAINKAQEITQDTARVMMETGAAALLQGLSMITGNSFDLLDPNFVGTPARIAKSYMEMCSGLGREEEVKEILSKNFPSKYEGMVIIDSIDVFSMCPHHFLPVKYKVDFGYIPNGKVLGLSKIPRFIDLLAKRPVLQEDLAMDIINLFNEAVKPEGCIVVLDGQHGCMQCRGAKQTNTSAITSEVSGSFKESATRSEFLDLIKLRR
jgi:GTP cyclohydrolase I